MKINMVRTNLNHLSRKCCLNILFCHTHNNQMMMASKHYLSMFMIDPYLSIIKNAIVKPQNLSK